MSETLMIHVVEISSMFESRSFSEKSKTLRDESFVFYIVLQK